MNCEPTGVNLENGGVTSFQSTGCHNTNQEISAWQKSLKFVHSAILKYMHLNTSNYLQHYGYYFFIISLYDTRCHLL